jgi:hypothetical protein
MADIRFSCQACHQHITCDEAWAGHRIQCPVCSKEITVPPKVTASISKPGAAAGSSSSPPQGGSLVPKVPEATKLALNQNAQQPAPAQQKHIPIRNLTAPPPKKEGPWKTIITVAAILVILGVAGYMTWPYIAPKFQKEEVPEPQAKAPRRAKKNAEAAPPAEAMPAAPESPAPPMADGTPQPETAAPVITNIVQTGPVIPAVYTKEIASVRIPSGRVNGKLSGSPFLPDTIRLDPLGTSQVLRFSEGGLAAPEREILVYLRLKPGDKLEGQKIEISEDMRPKVGMPQVSKRWKTNPKYAPTLRSFSYGYVMKLELSQHAKGTIKGKVYISLPDTEQTVMGGNFVALTSIPTEGVQAPNAPGTVNPAQPGMPLNMMEPGAAEMQRRYGR